jgi:antitoxin MazE
MQTHVQKWGNSLGIRIPVRFSRNLGLEDGSPVDITVKDGIFIVCPKKNKLESMLALVSSKNLHHAVFEDASKGEELL